MRVCRAVKTSSNYLLMVFIPRSHTELHRSWTPIGQCSWQRHLIGWATPPLRIQFVTLSECCKGIHINIAEDQTILQFSKYSKTLLSLICDDQIRGQCSGHVMFTGVVTSLWSWLAASPCPLSGWSSPVSSASAPVCWTAMGEMKDWLIYSHTTWSGQKWYLFQRKHVSNKIRLVFNCKLEPHLVCLSLHFLPPGAGLLGVKKLPLETVGNKIVLRR